MHHFIFTGGVVKNITKPSADNISVDQLATELSSVALEWKTLRNIRECVCSTPFDHFSRKVMAIFFLNYLEDQLVL